LCPVYEVGKATLGAAAVLASAGVDLDSFAGLDEQRHLNDEPGFERCWLGRARNPIALDTWFGLGDGQLDARWNVNANDFIAMHLHDVVHEDVGLAIVVHVEHRALVDHRPFELLARTEGAVDDGSGASIAQRAPYESRALARLHVLEVDNLKKVVVDLERHSGFEVVR